MIHLVKTLACVGLSFLVATSASAQNPDYVLSASNTGGPPGSEVGVSVTLDNGGDPVEGWSFGLCHDAAELTAVETSQGLEAMELNGGDGPDYFFQEILADGVRNIAVCSFIGIDEIQPGQNELFRVIYLLEGPSGTLAELDFCSTLGNPPTAVVLSANIEPVIPVQESGSVDIDGVPLPPEFGYEIPDVTATFDPDTGVGAVTARPKLTQTVGFSAETSGFSMGIAHEPQLIAPSFAEPAGPLLDLNGGAGPDLFLVSIVPGGITIDVDYGADTIVFGSSQEVALIQYNTNAPNLQGSPLVTTILDWTNGLGVTNEVIVGTPPMPLAPSLENGTINLIPLLVPPVDTLAMTSAYGQSGDTVQALAFLSTTIALAGWSYGVCHDGTVAEVQAVAPGFTTLTVNNGTPADFFIAEIFASDGWNNGVVVNFLGQASLPPGIGYGLADASYLLVGTLGATTDLTFCNTINGVDIVLVDTNGGTSVPATQSGLLEIGAVSPLGNEFLRGDADGNGVFNGLVDGLFILEFQFSGGSPPPCADAADVDDDGTLNGLVDGIYLLNYQFLPGSPPPPPPGALDCGADPTSDGLDCNGSGCP